MVKQDNQFAVNLIGLLSDYAIKKEFLCMTATRYKFISVVLNNRNDLIR